MSVQELVRDDAKVRPEARSWKALNAVLRSLDVILKETRSRGMVLGWGGGEVGSGRIESDFKDHHGGLKGGGETGG